MTVGFGGIRLNADTQGPGRKEVGKVWVPLTTGQAKAISG